MGIKHSNQKLRKNVNDKEFPKPVKNEGNKASDQSQSSQKSKKKNIPEIQEEMNLQKFLKECDCLDFLPNFIERRYFKFRNIFALLDPNQFYQFDHFIRLEKPRNRFLKLLKEKEIEVLRVLDEGIDQNVLKSHPLRVLIKKKFGEVFVEKVVGFVNEDDVESLREYVNKFKDILLVDKRTKKIYCDVCFHRVETDDLEMSILSLACKKGNYKMVLYLFETFNWNVNARNKMKYDKGGEGLTSLYFACEGGDLNVVKLLLKQKNIDVNRGYQSPLYSACSKKHVEIARMLLDLESINLHAGYHTPLYGACRNGLYEIVKKMISKGVDVNKGGIGRHPTPLYAACLNGSLIIVKLLLEKKEIKLNEGGESPLVGAAESGNKEILMLLLKRKDIDVNYGFYTPLSQMCKFGRTKMVKALLERKDLKLNTGRSCYHLVVAAQHGHLDVVKALIEMRGDEINVNWTPEKEFSALYYSCKSGHLKVVEYLLNHKSIDVNSDSQLSCLHACCVSGHLNVVKKLLTLPNLNRVRGMKESPLMGACRSQKYNVVKELLKHIIDDEHLKESFFFVCKKGYTDLVILFLQSWITFNSSKLKKIIRSKEVLKVVDEFLENQSLFRQKYGSLEKYNINSSVKEFYKAAIIIGNEEYEDFDNLNVSKRSAKQMERLFKEIKFDKIICSIDNDEGDMFDEFDTFFSEIMEEFEEKKETLSLLCVVYFNGYVFSFNGISYFLPTDFEKVNIQNQIKLSKKCISSSYLENQMNQLSKNLVGIILNDYSLNSLVEIKKVLDVKSKKSIKSRSESIVVDPKVVDDDVIALTRGGFEKEKIGVTSNDNFVYCYSHDAGINDVSEKLDYSFENKFEISPFALSSIKNFGRKGKLDKILISLRNDALKITKFRQTVLTNSTISFPLIWNFNSTEEVMPQTVFVSEEKEFHSMQKEIKRLKKINLLKQSVINSEKGNVMEKKEKLLEELESHLSLTQREKINSIPNDSFVIRDKMKYSKKQTSNIDSLFAFRKGIDVIFNEDSSNFTLQNSIFNNNISIAQLKRESILNENGACYVEILIKKLSDERDTRKARVSIGFGPSSLLGRSEIGRSKFSIGYCNDGYVYNNRGSYFSMKSFVDSRNPHKWISNMQESLRIRSKEYLFIEEFKENDVIGCGWVFETGEVFFTKNGILLQNRFYKSFQTFGKQFLPIITFRNNSFIQVEVLAWKNLKFNLKLFSKVEKGKFNLKFNKMVTKFVGGESLPFDQDLGSLVDLIYKCINRGSFKGFSKLIKYFLEHEGEFLVFDKNDKKIKINWYHILRECLKGGNVEMIKLLLSLGRIDMNDAGEFKSIDGLPLIWVSKGGNLELFNLIYKFDSNIDVNKGSRIMNYEKGAGVTPLYHACAESNVDIVKELLKNEKVLVNFGEKTPYIATLANYNHEIFSSLTSHKDIKVEKVPRKKSFFDHHYACSLGGNFEIYNKIKKMNLFNNNSPKTTPLHGVCRSGGDIRILKDILSMERFTQEKVLNAKGKYFLESTALYDAVRGGHESHVKLLLEQKNIRIDGIYELTPLYEASKSGYDRIVKEILKKKPNILIRGGSKIGRYYWPSIFIAAKEGHLNIVKLLYSPKGYKLDDNIEYYQKAICGACSGNDNIRILRYLLSETKSKNIDINYGMKYATENRSDPTTALCLSCESGSVKCALELLTRFEKEIDVHKGYVTALYYACKSGSVEIVKALLKRKDIKVNKGDYSHSPLYAACRWGDNIEVVKELLKRNDIDINAGSATGFQGACESGNLKFVKILLHKGGVDINKAQFADDSTTLTCAIYESHFSVVKELVKQKFEIDVSKDNPLHSSVCYGNFNMVKVILNHMKNREKYYPFIKKALKEAIKRNELDMVILFLQRAITFKVDKKFFKYPKLEKYNKMKKVLFEFISNKPKFRQKYEKFKRYQSDISVKTFFKSSFVIGMKKYDHLQELKTSLNDATEIDSTFRKDYKFDYSKIVLNKKMEELKKEFVMFCEELKVLSKKEENKYKNFLTVIFYSGHGITHESLSFLLPIDFKKEYIKDNKLLNENGFSSKKIEKELGNVIEKKEKHVILFILDACRTNVDNLEVLEQEKDGKLQKKNDSEKTNTLYCFATDPNAVALDSSIGIEGNSNHSPFTTSLLNVMKNKVTKTYNIENILIDVRNQTLKLTKNNQKPWWNSSLSYPLYWGVDKEVEYILGGENVKENLEIVISEERIKKARKIKLEEQKKSEKLNVELKEKLKKSLDHDDKKLLNTIRLDVLK